MGCTRKVRLEEGGEGTYAWTERWDCYGRGKKQRLSVVWFQSPFKHFNAPGIQLKDAIIFFTTHATSPLFSPYNCTSTSYFIDVAGGRTCGYPVASQLTWAKRIFGMYTLIRHRSHFQAFKHKIHQQTATLKHPFSMSNYLFFYFFYFFLLKIILSCWGIQVSSIWLNLDPSILHQCF